MMVFMCTYMWMQTCGEGWGRDCWCKFESWSDDRMEENVDVGVDERVESWVAGGCGHGARAGGLSTPRL